MLKEQQQTLNSLLEASRAAGKNQFLTYYMIAAHPGCEEKDMRAAKRFVSDRMRMNPEQVQIFTPLPSSWSSVMYWTGKDPFTGEKLFAGDSELSILEQVRNPKVELPSKINPAVSSDIDTIVLKALEPDRAQRYQSARDLQRNIEKVMRSKSWSPGSGATSRRWCRRSWPSSPSWS